MNKIEVIGLGAGDLDQLSIGLYRKLTKAEQMVYVRTTEHPVVQALQEEGVSFKSFDEIYASETAFEQVYERIAAVLLEKASEENVIYAVPGHPMLAERSIQLLLQQQEVDIEILGGQSYLDALFSSLRIDPIEGFQFVDAATFQRSELNYRQHLVFCQVYDQWIASELKLTLLEDLPPHYEVTIVEAAGSRQEQITVVPLEKLDHAFKQSNLVSVYVPPAEKEMLHHTFDRLKEVIAELRGPNGCPWDKEQTHESLRTYAIEEVYELIDAIDEMDDEGIVEELGDMLLQVMLHSQIGTDDGYFTIDDVIASITNKMIYRHPHVFGDLSVGSVNEVYKNWEQLKKEEKGDTRKTVLSGIPSHLPALAKAFKLQQKAAKVGFTWEQAGEIWDKLQEELFEVKQAIKEEDLVEVEKEFGDVLFVLANLTRYYGINPEVALNRANQKFISRFGYIEQQLEALGKKPEEATLEEMDAYWEQAKEREGL
ncbi:MULTISPECIES: nucleoside triphosphate pyrophosphohydrolase [unclassified Virgibacillus]|uniref:nucleoside triphosphate pyrophosphohydrolase n=1 Tax=unclassified Virgibacillus TaxID=2620237 RepID=UPI0024DEA0A7|nr:nucleoside triphosphate pyrophosphohydrolase [Virgibacillus sp. LDC-1]